MMRNTACRNCVMGIRPSTIASGALRTSTSISATCSGILLQQRRWALVSVGAPPPGTTTLSKETLRDPNLRNATKPFSGVLTAAPGTNLSNKKKKNKNKSGGGGGTNTSGLETHVPETPQPTGPPDLEAFSQPLSPIVTLDPFARNRVINFAKKVAGEASSGGEDQVDTGDTGTFVCTQTTARQQRTAKFMCEVRLVAKVPVMKSDDDRIMPTISTRAITGIGYANDEKSAQIVAAMHAERCLDELGICVFSLPRMQQKYAAQARAEGRSAPYPGDPPRKECDISTPFPLLHIIPSVQQQQAQQQQQHTPVGSASPAPLDFTNKNDVDRARRMLQGFERDRQLCSIQYTSDPFGTRCSSSGTSNGANEDFMKDVREGRVFADEVEGGGEDDGVTEVRFEGDDGADAARSRQQQQSAAPRNNNNHQSAANGAFLDPSRRLTQEMLAQSRRQTEKIRQLNYMIDESEGASYNIVDDQLGYLSWPHTTLSSCFFNFGAVNAIEEYVRSYHLLKQLHQLREIEEEASQTSPSSNTEDGGHGRGEEGGGMMTVQLPPLTTLEDLVSISESVDRSTYDVTMATKEATWYTVTFLVPGIPHHYHGGGGDGGDFSTATTPFQPALAKGKATTKEKAMALACMHAEFLLDQHHMPLYPLNPIKQLAHHEATLDVGRYAIRPKDEDIIAYAGAELAEEAIQAAKAAAMDTIQLDPKPTSSTDRRTITNPRGIPITSTRSQQPTISPQPKPTTPSEMTISSIDDLFAEGGGTGEEAVTETPTDTVDATAAAIIDEEQSSTTQHVECTPTRPYRELLPPLHSGVDKNININADTIYMEAFALGLEGAAALPALPRSRFIKPEADMEAPDTSSNNTWQAPPTMIKPLKEWHKVLKRNGEKSRHRYSSLTEEENFMSCQRQFVARHRMHLCEFGRIQDPTILEEMRFCKLLLREFCAAKGEHRRESFITFVLTEGSQYRSSYLLPLHPKYGNRGGYAIGHSAESSQLLAALHAVDTLCALCIPVTNDPVKYTKLTQMRRAQGRIPPALNPLPVNPLMRSPPAYRETDDSQARPPSHLEAWRVMMIEVSEFNAFKQPANDANIQLVRGGEAPLMTILRQIIVNYLAVHGGHPELRLDADKGDMMGGLLGHYNGHQRAGPRAAVAANNYWMDVPVPPRFGKRYALGRCVQRKGAQKSFAIHFVRTLFTLGLYPNETLSETSEILGKKAPTSRVHPYPILPTRRTEPSLQYLYENEGGGNAETAASSSSSSSTMEKKRPGIIMTMPGQPPSRRQLAGLPDWELWLSLPDGILADLRGSPELHAVMKQQREFEEQQRIARFAQNNGDASSQAGGVRVTVVDEDPTTASASGRPATPPGGKPGIWNDGVWIANGTAPLDEIQFPAAWAVKKHQQLIATVVSPRDQTVPPGIPTPNPVITASCKEIAFSKI